MTVVEGKRVTLYVYRDDVPIKTVCATNLTKRIEAEKINITTVDSDRENEYIGGSTDAEIGLEGIRTLDETGSWQADDFEDLIGEVVHILISYDNALGDRVTYNGYALITSVDDNNGASDFSSYSISMVRSGAWTKTKIYNALLDSDGNPVFDSDGNLIR